MTDPINNLTPGTPLTPEQKEAMAKANVESSTEAHRLAAEQQERDRQECRGEPPVQTIANMLKKKLEIGDIHPPEDGTVSRTLRE